jgi:hypothetical protein
MIELEHSPLGGSGANRWLTCGNSFLLQRLLMLAGEYEQPLASAFADKGTAAHELGAICLTEAREPFEFIGKKIGDYLIHPDDLDPNAVAVYVATCEAIAAAGEGIGTTLIEQTISLPDVHPLFKGTVDFAHWRMLLEQGADGVYRPLPNAGFWLVDYKNGEGIGVRAAGNKQLMYYALLLVMKFPELRNAPRDFPVFLGIVQPNFFGIFEEPEFWPTTIGEISDFGFQILLPAMQRLLDDKREMLPVDEFVSGDHCQFCPVMLDCPKLRKAYETFANGDDFAAMLSDNELSDLYALRDDARRFGNELEKVVYARKISGKDISSAKLVEKISHRVWKSGAEDDARRKFGDGAYSPRKLKSPAQMEKLSSDGKAFALEWGFKPDSDRLTVAPVTDRRPEVVPPSNTEIFKNFAIPLEDLGW